MRVLLVSLLLMALPLAAIAGDGEAAKDAAAVAADAVDVSGDHVVCGLNMPCTCQITCINVGIDCCEDKCSCECPTAKDGALRVDFLCAMNTVLGSATLEGPWCDPCGDCEKFANLDKAVNPQDVCSVRLTWLGENGINVKAIVIRVMSEENNCGCCKADWDKIFKCKPACCTMVDSTKSWLLTQDSGCGDSCGCKSKCGSKCGDKCGCKSKCGSKCGDKCGCKDKCGSKCGDKCGCKSKCGSKCGSCNKCEKKSCGCKDKCGCKSKCGSKCGDKCGGKCGKSKCGCGKC